MPEISAAPFEVLSGHAVDHVFATWYEADRQSSILVVVDVSGSMSEPASSSHRCRCRRYFRVGRRDAGWLGSGAVGVRVPARPAADYLTLVERAPLDAAQRGRVEAVVGALDAGASGTGLYDSTLAAYLAAQADYRSGVPNHVIVFTDGKNEDDLETITIEQLTQQLVAAQDPGGPWR